MSQYVPQKIDLTPRKHHGYAVILFILGTLLPPLAVAARFGIGKDFWLNLLLTICGYIPGHGHNFYIQNIRNNKTHARTPKWIQKYGLVDTSEIKRKERKSQWASRYNDRLPRSTLDAQPYEEGQEQGSSLEISADGHGAKQQRNVHGELWRAEDESYYGERDNASTSSGRWHYPANFDDAAPASDSSKRNKKKKGKKDRWERTTDAYSLSEEQEQSKRKKSKKRKSRSTASLSSRDSSANFPEEAEGGLYGNTRAGDVPEDSNTAGTGGAAAKQGDDMFSHQF